MAQGYNSRLDESLGSQSMEKNLSLLKTVEMNQKQCLKKYTDMLMVEIIL